LWVERNEYVNRQRKLTTGIGTVTGKTGLDALIACLLGGGRTRGRCGTLPPGTTGAGQRLFAGVTFVNVSRKQITELKETSIYKPTRPID